MKIQTNIHNNIKNNQLNSNKIRRVKLREEVQHFKKTHMIICVRFTLLQQYISIINIWPWGVIIQDHFTEYKSMFSVLLKSDSW